MTDEEKKAIDYYINNEYSFGFETDMDIESFKKAIGIEETDEDTWEKHQIRFKTLLNLIEKQQKEIENLKELMAHKNGYTKQLEEDLFKNASNYVVSKDKIRDKIEELDNQQKQWLEDRKIKNSDGEIIFARNILEKLLEEE